MTALRPRRFTAAIILLAGRLAVSSASAASGAAEPDGSTYAHSSVRVGLGYDVDDKSAWRVRRQFRSAPTAKNAEAVKRLMNDAATGSVMRSTGALCAVLEDIETVHASALRDSVILLLDSHGGNTPLPDSVMRTAVRTLVALGGHNVEVLERIASESSDGVQSTIAAELQRSDDADATTLLMSLSRREAPMVRARALSSLATSCDLLARPLVIPNLTSADEDVRGAAWWWMARCGCGDDDARLVAALRDESRMVRTHALQGLIRMRSRVGCPALDSAGLAETETLRILTTEYRKWCQGSGPE